MEKCKINRQFNFDQKLNRVKLHVKWDILSQLHLWTSVCVLSTHEARKENSRKEGKVKEYRKEERRKVPAEKPNMKKEKLLKKP